MFFQVVIFGFMRTCEQSSSLHADKAVCIGSVNESMKKQQASCKVMLADYKGKSAVKRFVSFVSFVVQDEFIRSLQPDAPPF